jgi:Uma2 family endonuclease
MALEARPWTRADLDRLPDDGNTYEVLAGELLVTPPPSPEHQEIVAWIAERLWPFVSANGLGRVYFPRSVIVAGEEQAEPDLMVSPIAVVESWDEAPTPRLVIEVASRATQRRDLQAKRDFYRKVGIEEYWVIDRFRRCVTRFAGSDAEQLDRVLIWRPRGSGAALEIDLAVMFAETRPLG